MKKGFTLIELLAVILILGIIALIAIPQVTNVIEQASKGAAETSAEHYISAVNDKIALEMLDKKDNKIEDGYKPINTLDIKISGSAPESGVIYIESSKIKNASFILNGYNIICDSKGKCNSSKGEYVYSNTIGITSINDGLSERPTTRTYLRYPVVGDSLGIAQVCLYKENKEFCLNRFDFETSREKIKEYVGYDESTWTNDYEYRNVHYKTPVGDISKGCSIGDNTNDHWINCVADDVGFAAVLEDDYVVATDIANDLLCISHDTSGCVNNIYSFYDNF